MAGWRQKHSHTHAQIFTHVHSRAKIQAQISHMHIGDLLPDMRAVLFIHIQLYHIKPSTTIFNTLGFDNNSTQHTYTSHRSLEMRAQ